MTVCIAAICDETTDDPKIILCSDTKASSSLGSANMLKHRILAPKWNCLVSGSDGEIFSTLPILKQSFIRHLVDDSKEEINETNVLPLIRNALNQRKRDKADELVQGKFAISYAEFLATGKTRLPDDQFRQISTEIELINIEADFVIAGFGDLFPILINTDGKCRAVIREDFVVCGEGGYLAQASLLNRSYSGTEDFPTALYSVWEAKKFAEGAPSVGEQTVLYVIHKDGRTERINADGRKFLDEQMKQLSRREIPELSVSPSYFSTFKRG